jgi:hypothetical protein
LPPLPPVTVGLVPEDRSARDNVSIDKTQRKMSKRIIFFIVISLSYKKDSTGIGIPHVGLNPPKVSYIKKAFS